MMAKHGDVATGPGWELRCGAWQDVLADVECDALITDPPYSARTHKGHDGGANVSADAKSKGAGDGSYRRELNYAPMGTAGAYEVAGIGARGWHVVLTDHLLAPEFERAWQGVGRCTFAPLVWYSPGSRVRLQGDGPACWTCQIVVSRPRSKEFSTWGALPGGYAGPSVRGAAVVGAKPLWLMQAIVRDYSRPGDLVCDPYAGGGTTLLAAVMEGRRAIGAELDPVTFDKAVARLRKGYTPDMFAQRALADVQAVEQELPW